MRLIVCMLIGLVVLAGCGGDDEPAETGTDVNKLLEETFSGDKQIDSGKVDLSASFEADESASVTLSGAFQSQGDGKLPKLDLDATAEGGGDRFEAGITSTGDQGFVSFQGTDYEVSGPVFRQIQAAYEEAQKQASSQSGGTSLATLGVDPRKWLTNARNAGESDVGGTPTIKITGGIDVPKLLDDLNAGLERVRSLGLQGSEELPEQLTDQQKREVADAVKNVSVEIETGKDDRILRRLAVSADITAPGAGAAKVRFDVSLLEVNEDQEVEAPENARPFDELLEGLGGLGIGGLGGAAPKGSGSGDAVSPENLDKFSQCIQDAGSDTDKQRECSELLTP